MSVNAAGGPGGRAYELVIYPQLAAAPGPGPCRVPATLRSTAGEVVRAAAALLGLPAAATRRLALAEVRETGGEEWLLEPGDAPVQRVRLWPRRAQEAHPPEDGYFFLLQEQRERGADPADDGAVAGSPAGPARSLAERGLLPRGPAELDDLCDLPELTEACLLGVLRQRFLQRKIYTYAGSILVAVNPFRFLPIYNPKFVQRYAGRRLGQLEPHVFALADVAFHALRATRRNQCIVISGESGSGKTQTTNFLIHCLTALSQKGHASGVERTILGAGPVLEAFGNAKTAHNNNSSRFGKFIQVNYLESGIVRGAVVEKYLLEKSRLVSQEKDERNYHVFYYLLLGVSEEERREFQLKRPEDYFYLNQHNLKIEDGEELRHDFERLKQAMEMVGFLPATRKQIFEVLSAILYLGNVTYRKRATGREEGLEVGPPEVLDVLSQLLKVPREILVEVLTKRKTVTANDKLILPYSLGEAVTARDSMAKSLYSALFDWIVLRINHALLNRKDVEEAVSCLSIGVLDIFGFEDFERNSFEQFCINYANERLQHYFTQHIFKLEQEEYRSEGLSWHHIEYSDNLGCIQLISKKPTGLFYLLDEESNFPHATSQTLLAKFKQQHEGSRYFLGTPVLEPAFVIQHFAGRVKYQVKDFREKNMDYMRPDIVTLLRGSDSAYVRALLGMDPVAEFRWAVLRAAVRAMAVLREAGRLRAERAERARAQVQAGTGPGPRSPPGEPLRGTGTPSEKLYRSSELEFSFAGSEELPPPSWEDAFALYESKKDMHDRMIRTLKGLPWQGGDPRRLLQTLGRLQGPRAPLLKTKGTKHRQTVPKNLLDARSLKLIVAMTLQDRTTKSLLHLHKKKKPPSISAQFQASLNKLLETLGKAEPFFIRCIRSNAEKKELCFDEELVLQQLRYTGMLETVRIRRSGYGAKYTFQEFTEQFQALLPRDAQPCREVIAELLQRMGVDPASYQIGCTKVFLKETQRQALQETLHREVVRKILQLQRWFRMLLERRHFLQMRRAAITIQACWRSYRVRRTLEQTQAAILLQAAWRGYRQRVTYRRQRQSIVRLQSLCRGHLQRRSFRQMLTDRQRDQEEAERRPQEEGKEEEEKEEEGKEEAKEEEEEVTAATVVGVEKPQPPAPCPTPEPEPRPPAPTATAEPAEKAASSREKRESRRQRGLEHVQFQKRHVQAARDNRWVDAVDRQADTGDRQVDTGDRQVDTVDRQVDTGDRQVDRQLDTEDWQPKTEGRQPKTEDGRLDRQLDTEHRRTDTEDAQAYREGKQPETEVLQNQKEDRQLDMGDTQTHRKESIQTNAEEVDSSVPEPSGNTMAPGSPTEDLSGFSDPDMGTGMPAPDAEVPRITTDIALVHPEAQSSPPERPTCLALQNEPPTLTEHTRDRPSPGGPAQIQRHRDGDLERLASAVELWRGKKLTAAGPHALSQSLDLSQQPRPTHSPPEVRRVSLSTSDVSRLLPSPSLSPTQARSQALADASDGEPSPKKPAVQKKKSGDTTYSGDTGLSPGPQPDSKSTFKRLFLHKSKEKKYSLEGSEELEPTAPAPQDQASTRKNPEAPLDAPARQPVGKGRKNRTLKVKVGKITVSEKWRESLSRRISNANELKFLDEFLLNKMNDLRSQKTPVESLFIEATEKFRGHLKTMYSVPNGKVHVGYEDLMEHFQMAVRSLAAERGQRDPSLELNLFQALLHEFTRSFAGSDFEPPKGKAKKKRKQERGVQQRNGHVFAGYQVSIPQSCEQCLSYIWLMDKALLCSVCKMTCHKKCLAKIQTYCSYASGPKAEPGHFGVRVDSLTSDKASVPVVLEKLLEHVEMHGLYTEGLYRKSGAANRTRELRRALQADPAAVKLESFPIHAVTGALKQWLRELPEPLMTFAQYGDFLHAVELPEKQEQLAAIYDVLQHLPEANHSSLERLIFHLVKVALLEDVNRMSPGALAIIFAPCLLRCPDTSDPLTSMKDVLKSTTCVEMLIKEQLRRYRVKMEEISQLEAAETVAVRRLSLLGGPWPLKLGFSSSYEGLLNKSPKARAGGGGGGPEELEPLPEEEAAGAEEDREKELLLERIQSIKEEKEDITYRLPELDPRGSDEENLDSETSASTESLLGERGGRAAAEGPSAPGPATQPAPRPPRCRPASFFTVRVKVPRRTPVMPTANIKLPPGLPAHLRGPAAPGEAPVRRREPPARRPDQVHSVYIAAGAPLPAPGSPPHPEQEDPPRGPQRRYSDPPSYCLPPHPGPAHG